MGFPAQERRYMKPGMVAGSWGWRHWGRQGLNLQGLQIYEKIKGIWIQCLEKIQILK